MRFNRTGPPREGQYLFIAEYKSAAFGFTRFDISRPRAVCAVDHLERLGAPLLLHDRREPLIAQQRFEYLIGVGIDRALHDILAEPPGGIDHHHPVEPGFRVDREHHAGASEV